MKHVALALGAAAAVVLCGCHGEGAVDSASRTRVEITSSPATPYVGETVTLTVTAHNDDLAIESIAIDYTDDDTLDETQTCDARAISLAFTHVYAAAGTYDVRAEVTDSSGTAASTSTQLQVVIPPPTIPLTLTVEGSSPQGGSCFALGPPITCPDCGVLVGTSAPVPVSVSLGQPYRGTQFNVNQGFNQWPVAFGSLYECTFHATVYAGEPGHGHVWGNGSCSTSSLSRPAQLDCNIGIAGVVQ